MKKYIFMALLGLSLSVPKAHAQWVVTDPGNFAGNIVNSVKEIATASKTVKNTLDGFKEVEKLYNDTKKYYDALKKVNNLIGDAYKVKECILMVGDISEIYVTSYKKMLSDKNFRPSELAAMASGYAKLLEQSGESLKELKSIVKSKCFLDERPRTNAVHRPHLYYAEGIPLARVVLYKEKHLCELRACKGEEQPCFCQSALW